MTTTIVFADASDGRLISSSSSYATARSGGTFTSSTTETTLPYGQSLIGTQYGVSASFVRWAYTPPANEVVTSAAIRLYHVSTTGAAVSRDLEIRQHDWGTTLEAADWVAADLDGGGPLLIGVALGTETATGKYVYAGSQELVTMLNTAGTSVVGVVLTSKNARIGQTPTGDEVSSVSAVDEAGTANDPALVYTTSPRSTLYGVLGAQVRMADGSWCVLESDGVTPIPAITLRRHAGGSITTIGTLTVGPLGGQFGAPQGAQGLALATDSVDRVYVVGRIGNAPNSLAVKAYTQSGGSWTGGTIRTVPLPSYGGTINNVAATVTATNGAYGDLYVMAGHGPDVAVPGGGGNELAYARLSGQAIVTGVGTVSLEIGSALGKVQPERTRAGIWNTFANEVGTGLDVVSPGDRTGYVVSFTKHGIPGDWNQVYAGRFDLDAASATNTPAGAFGSKDGSSKLRAVSTGGTTFCVVSADRTAGYGITVAPYQVTGAGWTPLAEPILLDSESVPSMPSASTVAGTQAWDAVYHAASNKLWIYYCPADRTVRRTSIDLSTHQAARDSITVATLGAAGGINLALRTPRNVEFGSRALATVAHRSSGGTLSTIYVSDSLNQAPTAPALAARPNFDATTAVPLSWTFTDPDLSDTQSAYEMEIVNVGTGATVVATGKVVSAGTQRTITAGTLTNGVTYQWRVRTYDSSDVVGPWSGYGSFTTAAGGTVTITNPATDNPAGLATDDYTISWSVAGTTQASYRVEVVRSSTGAVLVDTGYVTSTATSYTVTGMLSDAQYEVRVTVRNGAGTTSNTGTRFLTPSYASPEAPTITVEPRGDQGYMLVQVDNPVPGEAAAYPLWTFEPGTVLGSGGSGGTADLSIEQAHQGTQSLKLTVVGTPTQTYWRATPVTVDPARRYVARVWVLRSTTGPAAISIDWSTSAGVYVSTSATTVTVTGGVWTEIAVPANVPGTAGKASYGPTLSSSPAAGTTLYADELSLGFASDRPAATGNEVYRRVAGPFVSPWLLLGTVQIDGQYRDYSVPSGAAYEYKARALAGGPYTDSAPASGTLALEGVWLHDPLDAEATVRQLRYGSALRSSDLDVVGTLTHYAGRSRPVADLGEHETESVRVAAHVPFGADWSACVAGVRGAVLLRRPLIMRDNRGRALRGVLSGYQESDQRYGTQVAFVVSGTDGGL